MAVAAAAAAAAWLASHRLQLHQTQPNKAAEPTAGGLEGWLAGQLAGGWWEAGRQEGGQAAGRLASDVDIQLY